MTSSVNGKKFNTPQWDLNDEFKDCEGREEFEDIDRVNYRDTTFCKNVVILGDLSVAGNVVIKGNLKVEGTITAPFFDGVAREAISARSIG